MLFLNIILLSSLNPGFTPIRRTLNISPFVDRIPSLTHITFLLQCPPRPILLSLETFGMCYFTRLFNCFSDCFKMCSCTTLDSSWMSLLYVSGHKWIILQSSLVSFSPLCSENKKISPLPFLFFPLNATLTMILY